MRLMQDLRVAIRNLRRAPGAALTVALTIAVGVASIATVFAVVDALFLRPLPGVERPAELVNVHATASDGTTFHSVTLPAWRELSADGSAFSGLAAFASRLVSLSVGREPRLAVAQLVSGNYFEVLGAHAAVGRLFGPESDAANGNGNDAVVVVSDATWRAGFAADPALVGRTILINGQPFTVVGVASPGFTGTFRAQPFDVWVPLSVRTRLTPGESFDPLDQAWLEMVGRRRPDVSMDAARRAMSAAARRLESDGTEATRGIGFDLRPTTGFEDDLRGPAVAFFTLLAILAGLVLAIAGANVTGILLARGLGREKEIGIRIALGAGRAGVTRLMLLENAIPFLAGGVLGVGLTFWSAPLLERFDLPTPVPIIFDFRPGFRVALFGLIASAAAGLVFGSIAAWVASRPNLLPLLRAGASTERRRTARIRTAFVAGELAFSVLLLVAAGLFRQSVRQSAATNPGFDPRALSVAQVDLSLLGYDAARGQEALRRLTEAVRRLPGVRSAAVASVLPLGLAHRTMPVGRPGSPKTAWSPAEISEVGEGYFETMRVPILRGREFSLHDAPASPPVVVVNETFARKYWPGTDAVGQTILSADGPLTVLGVARDGKYRRLSEPAVPFLYLSSTQSKRLRREVVVRSDAPSASLAAALRSEWKRIDPALPFAGVLPMEKFIGFSTLPQRVASAVSGALGAVGLALAAIGLAGLVAESVRKRTREIGLRLAVGARPRDVVILEVRRAARLAIVGFAGGALPAALAAPLLRQFLFGVHGLDPVIFLTVAGILAATTFLAAFLPARRAARLDPLAALRAD